MKSRMQAQMEKTNTRKAKCTAWQKWKRVFRQRACRAHRLEQQTTNSAPFNRTHCALRLMHHATPTAERLRELPAAPAIGGEERKVKTEKTWRSAKLSTHDDNNDNENGDVAVGEDNDAVEEDEDEDEDEASQGSWERNGNKTRTANNCSCTSLYFCTSLARSVALSLFLSTRERAYCTRKLSSSDNASELLALNALSLFARPMPLIACNAPAGFRLLFTYIYSLSVCVCASVFTCLCSCELWFVWTPFGWHVADVELSKRAHGIAMQKQNWQRSEKSTSFRQSTATNRDRAKDQKSGKESKTDANRFRTQTTTTTTQRCGATLSGLFFILSSLLMICVCGGGNGGRCKSKN